MIILHVQQVFKDTSVLNKAGFWMWQGCICKGYAGLPICLIIVSYASIILNIRQFALILFNMRENGWILLNFPKFLKTPEQNVLTISRFSICRNIFTRTTLLELLLSQLVTNYLSSLQINNNWRIWNWKNKFII